MYLHTALCIAQICTYMHEHHIYFVYILVTPIQIVIPLRQRGSEQHSICMLMKALHTHTLSSLSSQNDTPDDNNLSRSVRHPIQTSWGSLQCHNRLDI